VSRIEQTAGDNGTVLTNTVIDEFLAPFQLNIGEVKINRINKTVQLEVKLEDTRFASALSSVTNETDETTDTITTKFWSAPGDVIVLAGLTRNSETTTTAGMPGTTGALGAISPIIGGNDGIENTLSETIIFMAPTVIDPSAEQQPHSAFRTRNRRAANQ
jgi:type II secretory pathway component GspD/PulD (secretin)